jgi:hypothetical protein
MINHDDDAVKLGILLNKRRKLFIVARLQKETSEQKNSS